MGCWNTYQKTVWRWLAPVLMAALTGCTSLSVNTQHDPYAQFQSYRTFDWMPENISQLPADEQLLSQQLKFTVEQELLEKGIVRDAQQPDFLISYFGSSERKTSQRVVETGDVWSDRRRYDAYHKDATKTDPRYWKLPPDERINYTRSVETQTVTYTEGTLVIDFTDAQSKQVVWQSTIQGVLSRSDPMKSITDGVRKAISQFPPQ